MSFSRLLSNNSAGGQPLHSFSSALEAGNWVHSVVVPINHLDHFDQLYCPLHQHWEDLDQWVRSRLTQLQTVPFGGCATCNNFMIFTPCDDSAYHLRGIDNELWVDTVNSLRIGNIVQQTFTPIHAVAWRILRKA